MPTKKITKLSIAVNREKAIQGDRNTPKFLQKLYDTGLLKTTEINGRIISCMALIPTGVDRWHELGTSWTDPDYRLQGLSSKIFTICLDYAKVHNLKLFEITHVPEALHLLKKHDFIKVTRDKWDDQVPISISCGECTFVENKLNCPARATKECQMFYLLL